MALDIVKCLRECDGNDAPWAHCLMQKAADEIEKLRLSNRSQKRLKYHAQSARNDHANGLDYWRERALAAETVLTTKQAEK